MKALISQALLGSQKLIDNSLSPQDILDRAARLTLQNELGMLPERSEAVFSGSFKDKTACPLGHAQAIAAILDGRYAELLAEALILILENNLRIPSELLPIVLDKGLKFNNLRPLIIQIVGETGEYLASQNPEWSYASAAMNSWEGLSKEWQETNIHRRQGILAQLRHKDPDLGRELVESRWETESLSAAIWIINIFGKNLVANDEPFLERALDSRNATVRRKSAEYLAALADSALTMRMFENMNGIISYNANRQEIEVNLPQEFSAEIRRDGLMKRMWNDILKVENAQVSDILSAVRLEHVQDYWNLKPLEIIAIAAENKYSTGLLKGFSLAAERQKNAYWAKLLLEQDNIALSSTRLLHILDSEQFTSLIKKLDNGDFLDKENPLVRALWRYQGSWSKEVLEIWLLRLLSHIKKNSGFEGLELSLRSSLKQAARLCPSTELEKLKIYLEKINTNYPSWQTIINEALALTKFRLQMHQAVKGA